MSNRNIYRIGVVVTGIAPSDISVTEKRGKLTIKTPAYEKTFPLTSGVSVARIWRGNDLLEIDLARNL